MKGKMQGVTLVADWDPKPGFKLGPKDVDGRQTYLGSQVWRTPRIEIREYDIPTPGPKEDRKHPCRLLRRFQRIRALEWRGIPLAPDNKCNLLHLLVQMGIPTTVSVWMRLGLTYKAHSPST